MASAEEVSEKPLTLQLSLLFWKPCKEKQQETTTTVIHRWATEEKWHTEQEVDPSCKSQALKCAESVPVILALTDISGSFLPPLLGEFLPLLWAHRVCSEKGKNFSSVFLSWTCSNRFFKPKAQRWCTFILKGGSFTLKHQVSSKQNLNKFGWPNIFLKLHAR